MRVTAETLRRRLVGGTASRLPRVQALRLAREAIEALADAEREIERLKDPLECLGLVGDAVTMREPEAGGSTRA